MALRTGRARILGDAILSTSKNVGSSLVMLTGQRRPLFDIVGAAQMVQIMTRSSLSDNFIIFWSTTTWHHCVSIQVANKSIYNFVGPIETVR